MRDHERRPPIVGAARTLIAAAALLAAGICSTGPAIAVHHIPRIAIVVGPVGEPLTSTYLELAEAAAREAERANANVVRAYSPNANPERVLDAVEGANIVVYFGHGTGFPNPYSDTLNPAMVNGWGLQGPAARGTHEDSWADGTLAYYGEAWIAAHARPAPGFVMIYSNVCYAPGAGEGHHPPATDAVARQRAGGYARTPLAMGASAVFATDFYAGAAELVGKLLSSPTTPYGDVVRSGRNYVADGVVVDAHPYAAGAELWLQRSAYFGGQTDYWFAFSGDPTASLGSAGIGQPDALLAALDQPLAVRVQPGAHHALRLDEAGAVRGDERWVTGEVTELAVAERRRLPDREGAWYRIAAGQHAGAWIAESAAVHPPGRALERALEPQRLVHLAAATHAGYRLSPEGTIAESRVATLPRAARGTADAVALVDGQLHVRLVDGIWAGHWLLVSDAVRLAGPVPLPPAAPEADPAPPAPANPPPPPAPSATPVPPATSSPTPTAPPVASSSAAPSAPPSGMPAPTATPTMSPSGLATPSPSPFPSIAPTPGSMPTPPADQPSPTPSPP